ncbi:MAG: glycogen synthase GlgA [Acidobacteria bacterium]|nr:glycogen synthase GlgA [Acidobacteriota bacterium]
MAKVMMVASEAAPFAKTGGLADVLGALPAALVRQGLSASVVMPKYRGIHPDGIELVLADMPVWINNFRHRTDIWRAYREGVTFYFVDAPWFYDRGGFYSSYGNDYMDNHLRFAVLSLAALGVARQIEHPDILHSHDWQAALVPIYAKSWFGNDPRLAAMKHIFTIHNLGYQGRFGKPALGELGLDGSQFHMGELEFFGDLNLMKGAIIKADFVTTVSPTYAHEIQTPEHGFGLDGLLQERSGKLTGILNGVDYAEWDPETDKYLPANYNAAELEGKAKCKRAVLETFGFGAEAHGRPLIGVVSRFAEQKGFDLLHPIGDALKKEDVTVVALGSGEPHYEWIFHDLATRHHDNFRVWHGYNNGLAHLIEAGADMFLMPSRYEPCGLNQIYSLKYGTPPVVRATGGLDDTIEESTGFKFGEYSPSALLGALRYALQCWRDQKAWHERMRLGMSKDFSWDRSAAEYAALYRHVLGD